MEALNQYEYEDFVEVFHPDSSTEGSWEEGTQAGYMG